MEHNRQAISLTKDVLEDLYIIAIVYRTTIEEVIKELTAADYEMGCTA